jgi:hypothetical protein
VNQLSRETADELWRLVGLYKKSTEAEPLRALGAFIDSLTVKTPEPTPEWTSKNCIDVDHQWQHGPGCPLYTPPVESPTPAETAGQMLERVLDAVVEGHLTAMHTAGVVIEPSSVGDRTRHLIRNQFRDVVALTLDAAVADSPREREEPATKDTEWGVRASSGYVVDYSEADARRFADLAGELVARIVVKGPWFRVPERLEEKP